MSNFHVDLTGKKALVTGAGEGIGWATALALAGAGAHVFTVDINPDRADRIADAIQAQGGQATSYQADVGNKLFVGPMIEAMRDTYGRIDLVINAAGVEKISPLLNLDEWDWRKSIEVNLNGTFFVTQLAGRVMAEEGGGVIVNLASTAGHGTPRLHSAPYAASKAGVIGFTREVAREFAPLGIRVNAVCAGNIVGDSEPVDLIRVAQGRAGTAEEVAQVMLFLCSDAASFITGQAIHVDGGENML